jgi:hypothetical protein
MHVRSNKYRIMASSRMDQKYFLTIDTENNAEPHKALTYRPENNLNIK